MFEIGVAPLFQMEVGKFIKWDLDCCLRSRLDRCFRWEMDSSLRYRLYSCFR